MRLKSLYMNSFKNNDVLFKEYNQIIQDQENIGIIEVIKSANLANDIGSIYYMPHKPVIRDDKTSTKVRMVFDASSCAKR